MISERRWRVKNGRLAEEIELRDEKKVFFHCLVSHLFDTTRTRSLETSISIRWSLISSSIKNDDVSFYDLNAQLNGLISGEQKSSCCSCFEVISLFLMMSSRHCLCCHFSSAVIVGLFRYITFVFAAAVVETAKRLIFARILRCFCVFFPFGVCWLRFFFGLALWSSMVWQHHRWINIDFQSLN